MATHHIGVPDAAHDGGRSMVVTHLWRSSTVEDTVHQAAVLPCTAHTTYVAVYAADTRAAYPGPEYRSVVVPATTGTAHTEFGYTQGWHQLPPSPPPPPPPATTQALQTTRTTDTVGTVCSTFTATFTGTHHAQCESVAYSVTTSSDQQQQQQQKNNVNNNIKHWMNVRTSKRPLKPPHLHYCDVCKVVCVGPQLYQKHLDGKKHKRKETEWNSGNLGHACPSPDFDGLRHQHLVRCNLCNVICRGCDDYSTHVGGAKHRKVVLMYIGLGKPIPSRNSTVFSQISNCSGTCNTATGTADAPDSPVSPGSSSHTSTTSPVEEAVDRNVILMDGAEQVVGDMTREEGPNPGSGDGPLARSDRAELLLGAATPPRAERTPPPVGVDHPKEVRDDEGKVIGFNRKPCQCHFDHPDGKEVPNKDRRHHRPSKEKVNPELQVEVKDSVCMSKLQDGRRQTCHDEYWRRWKEEHRRVEGMCNEMFWRVDQVLKQTWKRRGPDGLLESGPGLRLPRAPAKQAVQCSNGYEDRPVMTHHRAISPQTLELQAVRRVVSHTERALELVCNDLPEGKGNTTDGEDSSQCSEGGEGKRVVFGVIRVGLLAKRLLLHGDLSVRLVLLCTVKPTPALLQRVTSELPARLAAMSEETHEVQQHVEEAEVVITSNSDPKTRVSVTLTSPLMEDVTMVTEDLLNGPKCRDALVAIRHANWFHAKAMRLKSCVVVIRIMRDLRRRVAAWACLPSWTMELLVQKAIGSAPKPLRPGYALRRVLECFAAGILLPGGPGLHDPCALEPKDVLSSMTEQQREILTASAQHALRLMAFKRTDKVLGLGPTRQSGIEPPTRKRNGNPAPRAHVEVNKESSKDVVH